MMMKIFVRMYSTVYTKQKEYALLESFAEFINNGLTLTLKLAPMKRRMYVCIYV